MEVQVLSSAPVFPARKRAAASGAEMIVAAVLSPMQAHENRA
jgi:hypothetical protein